MPLTFSDGMTFNMDGPLRLTRRSDGWHVVGEGMLIPIRDAAEGREIIEDMKKSKESGR